jgi:feruloyl esterase
MGNGGFGGSILYQVMGAPLSRHYAVAATDTGHEGSSLDASFAIAHREKLIDFAYRAVHEMTVKSKLVIETYYRRPPTFSYWDGCSDGGAQAFSEATRYPADYNGIIAGAPPHADTSRRLLWKGGQSNPARQPGAPVEACVLTRGRARGLDALDGVKDGILQDPRRCDFDPRKLECKNGDDEAHCLTPAQVRTVQAFYAPLVNPRTKAQIFPGLEHGGELIWGNPEATGSMVAQSGYGTGQWFRDAVFRIGIGTTKRLISTRTSRSPIAWTTGSRR